MTPRVAWTRQGNIWTPGGGRSVLDGVLLGESVVAVSSEAITTHWFSDNRSGTGTGDTAVLDGGKWLRDTGQRPDIITTPSGVGYPADLPAVLRFDGGAGFNIGVFPEDGVAPTLSIGERRVLRFFTRYVNGDSTEGDDNTHNYNMFRGDYSAGGAAPFWGSPSFPADYCWSWNHLMIASGAPDFYGFGVGDPANAFGDQWSVMEQSTGLDILQAYRVVTVWEYVSASPDIVSVECRIYEGNTDTIVLQGTDASMQLPGGIEGLNGVVNQHNGYEGNNGFPYAESGGWQIADVLDDSFPTMQYPTADEAA